MRIKGRSVYENVLDIPGGRVCLDNGNAYTVKHAAFPANHQFDLATSRSHIIGGQPFGSVTFDHQTRWHELSDHRGVWMTDLPIEQEQHDLALDPVKSGTVLIGGLGLGYALTVLAQRQRVSEITVVEISPAVITLVADAVLRRLPPAARRKVTIVQADVLEYLRRRSITQDFDWAFYDVWRSDGESTFFHTVLPLLNESEQRVIHRPICWNEDVMRGQLYHSLEGRLLTATSWKMTDEQRCESNELTLDKLAEAAGTFWLEWSTPFFRWLVQTPNASKDLIVRRMAMYAGGYGTAAFALAWLRMTGIAVPLLDTSR